MTEPSPGPHPDLAALAELDQGIVDEPEATTLSRHLSDCEECTQQLARVRTTRALLSALPTEPIPPAVANRIDAALDRVAESRAPAGVLPMPRRRPWWRSPAVAGSAAAAAVALLVAGIVFGSVLRHKHDNGSSPTTSGAAAGANRSADAAGAGAIKEWQTGTNYTPTNIASLVPRLIAGTPTGAMALPPPTGAALTPAAPTGSAAATRSFTLDQLRASRDAVLQCGRILADDPTAVPLAIDFARFNNAPAVIVVLPTPGDPHRADVYVLRQPCSTAALFSLYRVSRGA